MTQSVLQAISYLAPNWFGFYQAVVEALQRSLSLKIHLHQSACDPLEDPLLLQDQLDLAFICGLPLMRHHQTVPKQLQILAAPVIKAPRYQNRPVYFADVIVPATSTVKTLGELAGKVFCYNDAGSNSGFNLMHWHLLKNGYGAAFFGEQRQSGSHQRSLQWVIDGQADCASLDSTVLEKALEEEPDLARCIRVIAAIGPSPMPPLVAATHLGATVIQQLQTTLQKADQPLQAAMLKAGIDRYVVPQWQDYENLVAMYAAVGRERLA